MNIKYLTVLLNEMSKWVDHKGWPSVLVSPVWRDFSLKQWRLFEIQTSSGLDVNGRDWYSDRKEQPITSSLVTFRKNWSWCPISSSDNVGGRWVMLKLFILFYLNAIYSLAVYIVRTCTEDFHGGRQLMLTFNQPPPLHHRRSISRPPSSLFSSSSSPPYTRK